jgi:hypothetical protein
LLPNNVVQWSTTLNTDVDVTTDNALQSLMCPTTSTGSATRRTIELPKADAGTVFTKPGSRVGTIAAAHLPTIELGESMRYKAIAATLGAASLIAMGIMSAEASVESSDGIGGAGTTVAKGPAPITRTSASFSPVVEATPPCGFTTQC